MSKDNIDESKLIGGKRKNGHKLSCDCHICENMENKAKRGGYKEEIEKEQEKMMGGSKKKNGHRKECECPICKNMNNSRKNGKRNGTKKRRGGAGEEVVLEEEVSGKMGGRKKKGNGHKPTCQCPICKNMRKGRGKKGGDIEKGDMDGRSNETSIPDDEPAGTVTEASDEDYDELDAAEERMDEDGMDEEGMDEERMDEEGMAAGPNVVGGTRRKRRNKRRKTRKTRKHRRHRR